MKRRSSLNLSNNNTNIYNDDKRIKKNDNIDNNTRSLRSGNVSNNNKNNNNTTTVKSITNSSNSSSSISKTDKNSSSGNRNRSSSSSRISSFNKSNTIKNEQVKKTKTTVYSNDDGRLRVNSYDSNDSYGNDHKPKMNIELRQLPLQTPNSKVFNINRLYHMQLILI